VIAFAEFAAARARDAERAGIHPLQTIQDHSAAHALTAVGSAWTRRFYDGDFHLTRLSAADLPAVSLIFVQSREGNTGADNPEDLGGGATDKHLIYEGVSRVAVDAVMAGAKSAEGENIFFSVWHPEIVALREQLGLPRHPAQIVVTGTGCIDPLRSRVFSVPEVPVYVLATPGACDRLDALRSRPWIRFIHVDGEHLDGALRSLRADFGITRISAIGGRTTATALLDQGLVQDVWLTTTARSAGVPDTPFYVGKQPPVLTPIVTKRGTDPVFPITFQHLAVATSARSFPTARR
jgi:riboflavin biosynthesis pyrimidine reductase